MASSARVMVSRVVAMAMRVVPCWAMVRAIWDQVLMGCQ